MELPKLIRQLQSEKCPPRVLEQVAQRIAREKTPARSLLPAFACAAAIACLLTTVIVWQWRAHREAQRALVRQQTQEAFGYIGQALIRAAAHTENALSKEAVPPLRNSFQTVKDKVTNPI